ncbi:hypothetical protein Aple_086640 [Acrocarpospora pleiomorpha]|uniref:Ferredoxin n=1 Tax=Acrocarpospora pleiomorpha TaxID=90975 RepID=A0A5M3XX77_9ACTN|nr:hypothetical protein [Acrocarpospora pleiomorpha]GES25765.1 hypothetical protein Aple_086640 [Acrocarpospora pleiomorpha]
MAKVSITCAQCLNTVEVEKFSPEHTSIQWQRPSAEICHELAGGPFGFLTDALVRGCSALRGSILAAEREGQFGDLTADTGA